MALYLSNSQIVQLQVMLLEIYSNINLSRILDSGSLKATQRTKSHSDHTSIKLFILANYILIIAFLICPCSCKLEWRVFINITSLSLMPSAISTTVLLNVFVTQCICPKIRRNLKSPNTLYLGEKDSYISEVHY